MEKETFLKARHQKIIEKYSQIISEEQQEKLGSIWMVKVGGFSESTAKSFGFTGKFFAPICFYDFERFGIPTKKEEWAPFWEKSLKCHKEKMYLNKA
jgi:hypothetical protein